MILRDRSDALTAEYNRGWGDGIKAIDLEYLSADTQPCALTEAMRQTHLIDQGDYSEEQCTNYWLGYYHGRHSRQQQYPTGEALVIPGTSGPEA